MEERIKEHKKKFNKLFPSFNHSLMEKIREKGKVDFVSSYHPKQKRSYSDIKTMCELIQRTHYSQIVEKPLSKSMIKEKPLQEKKIKENIEKMKKEQEKLLSLTKSEFKNKQIEELTIIDPIDKKKLSEYKYQHLFAFEKGEIKPLFKFQKKA